MDFQRILITGGAGFVGSSLLMMLRRDFPGLKLTALDNLKRRGSEFNIPRLREAGIEFIHGDTRFPEDLENAGKFDLLIDCAAEPSVHAGLGGSPKPVFDVNLNGTVNCLEAARRHDAAFLFLSTSRVYPVAPLNQLKFEESPTRFQWTEQQDTIGASAAGISEDFPLAGSRSYYGASKLASELIAQEYAWSADMPVMINRCGVLTGPWQMGRADQGVIALWVLRHHFQKELRYIGYGGTGHQVRDVLHVDDLYTLLRTQLSQTDLWDGRVYNVGGGRDISVSLLELTNICRSVIGQAVPVASSPDTSHVDLRIFLTDSRRVQNDFSWTPQHSVNRVVSDIHNWVRNHEDMLKSLVS